MVVRNNKVHLEKLKITKIALSKYILKAIAGVLQT